MKLSKLAAAFAVALFVAGAGYAARPQKWLYTALGDSLAVGAIAFKGYVPRYQDYVQTDARASVSLRNLAQNGWTSADLLNALQTDDNFRSSVRSAAVVTWDIGGNDMRAVREAYKNGACDSTCLAASVAAIQSNWDGIIAAIVQLRNESAPPTKTIMRTMNLYNPYVNEDKLVDSDGNGRSDFEDLLDSFKHVNEHIGSTTAAAGILCADVALAFNGAASDEDPADKGYIAFDGLHPNDQGHKVMADLLRALGYRPLARPGNEALTCRSTL
jgi:lysophospholipase L1-like esterase